MGYLLIVSAVCLAFFAGRFCGGFTTWMKLSTSKSSGLVQGFLAGIGPVIVWRVIGSEAGLWVSGLSAISYLAGALSEDWINYGEIRWWLVNLLFDALDTCLGKWIKEEERMALRPGHRPNCRPIIGASLTEH